MADPDYYARAISATALIVSAAVAWLTLFRRGSLLMTRPAFIAFSYDIEKDKPKAKIFIRSLLYSTGKRGHVIESMFLRVRYGGTEHTFNVWGYGEDNKLTRGSGLFVGETGVVVNHHFNPPFDIEYFPFRSGGYEIEVFATLVAQKSPLLLSSVTLSVPETPRNELEDPSGAVWFDWTPDLGRYHGHIEKKSRSLS